MEAELAFPKVREPQALPKAAPRRSRPEKLVRAIFFIQMAEQGLVMKCGCGCGRILTLGNIRGEHLTPREQTVPGVDPDRPENQRYWCLDPCSLAKDKRDAKTKAKERRILKQTKGSRAPKAKIRSAGFRNGKGGAYKSSLGKKTVKRQGAAR